MELVNRLPGTDLPTVSFIGLPTFEGQDLESNVNSLALRDVSTLEEYEVNTACGIPLKVFVQPSKCKSAILTYHDIGTNYSSFLGFFSYPEMRVITHHFTVYHVCAPGHHEGALNVSESSQGGQLQTSLISDTPRSEASGDRSSSLGNIFSVFGRPPVYQNPVENSTTVSTKKYPDMDQLAEMLTSVVDYFKIKYFIGFGMGAGSNVLARFALHHPDNVSALFLINPNGTTHGYYEWFRNRWSDLPQLENGIFTDNLLNQLEAHWFGFGLANNEDLVNYYGQLLRTLNPVNVAGYIDAYINRTDLGLVRCLDLPSIIEQREKEAGTNSGPPTALKVNCFLVTGSLAQDLGRALSDLNGRMDPRKTQFLIASDCTGFLMEENPDKLSINFLHFLHNEGLVINLSPEKLHAEAAALQIEAASLANFQAPSSKMAFLSEI